MSISFWWLGSPLLYPVHIKIKNGFNTFVCIMGNLSELTDDGSKWRLSFCSELGTLRSAVVSLV
jgi:hypothetical protein